MNEKELLTPIGKILKFCDDHEKMSDYAVGTDSLRVFAQSLCTEEREVIKDAFREGKATERYENYDKDDYFNETFKNEP